MPKVKTRRMRNILLATDFSQNAHFAALFAGEFTRQNGGRLVVFHALSPLTQNNADGGVKPEYKSSEEAAQRKLDVLARELHLKFGISVSRLLKPGYAREEIVFIAEHLKAELIVMGSQGENSLADRTMGSVSAEIIKNKDIPVLCIPPESMEGMPPQTALAQFTGTPLSNKIGIQLLKGFKNQLTSPG